MDGNKMNLAVMILHCILAVAWDVHLFLRIANGWNTSSAAFVFDIIWVIVLHICAVYWILRYIKSKKEK